MANKVKIKLPIKNTSIIINNDYMGDEHGNMIDGNGRICGSVDYETGVVSLKKPVARHIDAAETSKPRFTIKSINGEVVDYV